MRSTKALRFALTLLPGLPASATAEVKEYQIRRMLMLKTECGVSGLDVDKLADNPDRYTERFVAICENVTHYSDWVEILCPDTEDERDCRILTVKLTFPHLHWLKP